MKKVGAVDYEIEMPGRRQQRKVYHVNLMKKGHVMTPKPQTVLLAADLEPMEDANESGSMKHQSWSGEIRHHCGSLNKDADGLSRGTLTSNG